MSPAADGVREPTAPIVAISPPSPAVRDSVARLVVEILARRALADLGIVASDDNEPPR